MSQTKLGFLNVWLQKKQKLGQYNSYGILIISWSIVIDQKCVLSWPALLFIYSRKYATFNNILHKTHIGYGRNLNNINFLTLCANYKELSTKNFSKERWINYYCTQWKEVQKKFKFCILLLWQLMPGMILLREFRKLENSRKYFTIWKTYYTFTAFQCVLTEFSWGFLFRVSIVNFVKSVEVQNVRLRPSHVLTTLYSHARSCFSHACFRLFQRGIWISTALNAAVKVVNDFSSGSVKSFLESTRPHRTF